ncbi:MAG TPA: alkaline phosphatase family protein [Terriglobales bacterium]|nr:alkaline phosphatase family protein [Terriglobales bacterium]
MKALLSSALPVLLLALSISGCGGVGGSRSPSSQPPSTSPIKNVIVVVMQNRSFDHLFGTFAGVDGVRAGVPGYSQKNGKGETVTPRLLQQTTVSDLPHGREEYLRVWNSGGMDRYALHNGDISLGYYDATTPGVDRLWSWAQQYALADRFFTSVMSSAPSNQLFMVAASDNNFPFSVHPFYGPCNTETTTPAPYTFRNLGDQLTEAGISWGWYQEHLWDCANGYIPQQNPFQYFTSTHESPSLRDYSRFLQDLTSGTLPAVSFVQPGPSESTHPSGGSITNGLNWLDGLIRQIQASSVWPGVALIVLWDESGGWWDHVPPPQVDQEGYGMRVPLLVISPHAKRNYVSHVQLDNVSVLKFIQENWGLPPLNSRNQAATGLDDLFAF